MHAVLCYYVFRGRPSACEEPNETDYSVKNASTLFEGAISISSYIPLIGQQLPQKIHSKMLFNLNLNIDLDTLRIVFRHDYKWQTRLSVPDRKILFNRNVEWHVLTWRIGYYGAFWYHLGILYIIVYIWVSTMKCSWATL